MVRMVLLAYKFLLAGDKFMPEMHLRQPAALGKPNFIYSVCGFVDVPPSLNYHEPLRFSINIIKI